MTLIKVDVEGAELSVLRSGHDLLTSFSPTVVVEMHPEMMISFGYCESDLYEFMNGLGYDSKQLSKRTEVTYQAVFDPKT